MVGLALQTQKPASITVSCDVVDPQIENLLYNCASKYNLTINYVRREHHGVARLNQVRNNGIRFLIKQACNQGRILILDGDVFAFNKTVEMHANLGNDHALVVASRILLDETTTQSLNPTEIYNGYQTIKITDEDIAELELQHRNSQRHQRLRKFKLTKQHKPKIIGAHLSASFKICLTINGFDEEYVGYGMDDDDFARRVYQSGGDSIIAIRQIPTAHLYHPTRANIAWRDYPGYKRFQNKKLPVHCLNGLHSPIKQNTVFENIINPADNPPAVIIKKNTETVQ